MEMVLGMPFLSFSIANIKFAKLKKLIWKIYTAAKALSTTHQVKFINKRKFTRVVLDENSKTFVVHIATQEIPIAVSVYLSRTSQVQRSNKPTLATL